MTADPSAQPNFFELYLNEQKAAWQNQYSATIFSVFDHWLSEEEAKAALDPYFAWVGGEQASPASVLEIEEPYLAFFEAMAQQGRLVRWRGDQQHPIDNLDEARSVALQAAREIDPMWLVEQETDTHLLPLHDLTLIAAVPIGQSLDHAARWAAQAGLYQLWSSNL
ncbi:MAG: hypothetical protein AAGJ10_15785 [Bacteroidota bacterium]